MFYLDNVLIFTALNRYVMSALFAGVRNQSPFIQLVFFVLFVLGAGIVFTLLGQGIVAILNGPNSIIDIASITQDGEQFLIDQGWTVETTPNYMIGALAILQICGQIGIFLVPSLLFVYLVHSKNVSGFLGIEKKMSLTTILLLIALMFLVLPLIYFLTIFNIDVIDNLPESLSVFKNWVQARENTSSVTIDLFLSRDTIGWLIVNIIMIAVLPAVGEELVFRGILQRLFTNMTRNYHFGVWIAAILFSAMHMQFYGFLPRLFLGLIFGYLLIWTKNLWIPIIGHFINNASAVLVAYFNRTGVMETGHEQFGATDDNYTIIFSAAVTVIICGYIIYHEKKRREEELRFPDEE